MPALPSKDWFDAHVSRFEHPDFIADDPISIPHSFSDPADREVIGLFAALLAWGQRKTTLNKLAELCARMRYQPAAFVRYFHLERDAEALAGFKHRTFNAEDAVWLVRILQALLLRYGSLEACFAAHLPADAPDIRPALQGFGDEVLSILPDVPRRLRKHIPRPSTGSACKRMNLYLRWMVRPGPVDFGQWTQIRPDQLVLPLDVHVGRQARRLGLLARTQDDWRAAAELTAICRRLDPHDPVRYDYVFFGLGIEAKQTHGHETT